jgi:hypothetical protein
MLDLEVNGYPREQVIALLHGKSGSRGVIKFRYDLLNKEDVKIGELSALPGNRVSLNSLAEIKRTAYFRIAHHEGQDIDWLNDRIQPVFCLQMPDNGFAEWPLGIFLLSSPTRRDENKRIKRDIEAYDASLIIKEDSFDDRYRIPAGTKYVTAITNILNAIGIWKVNIADHAGTLSVDKEFEIGTTKLEVVNQLLTEINYTSIWVDEGGYFVSLPYILPTNKEAEYEYRNNDISIIHPGSTQELDLFSLPNKWVRYVSNPDKTTLRSIYINDLATSPTSIINRGRVIVDLDSVDDIFDQATLNDYVKRVAYEASIVYGKFSFSTALMPHHSFYNCLFVEHTDFGISSKYMEASWDMELQAGGKMTHNCRQVIHI